MTQKKLFLWTAALLCGFVLHAQQRSVAPAPALGPAPYQRVALLPEAFVPEANHPIPSQNLQSRSANYEELVGLTRWDAQSYGCMPSRIYANSAGAPTAVWAFANDPFGAYPERGTGYNVRGASDWPFVNNRVESVRTGFPAAARLLDGTELIVSHATGFSPFRIYFGRKTPGSDTWTESYLDNPPGAGCLWPRIATGGPDGKTVHVIAITTPITNGGVAYEGVDAHILYWRSLDGGVTWDKKAQIIPGLDNSKYARFSADSYIVEAFDEVVAIAALGEWNDTKIFKSTDNGDTWSSFTVIDFPDGVENYVGADGDAYTFNDIVFFDPDAPDSLAIFTNDGFAAMLIDPALQVHFWFGRMYVVDNDPAEGTFFYPGTNGLNYWREDFGDNSYATITGALDINGDGVLNVVGGINGIGRYFCSLSSFPTAGIDANGAIYLAYSAFHELYTSGQNPDQHYRHVYIMRSTDGGESWTEPFDLINEPFVEETIVPFLECVWPALPREIGDQVWLIYQQDFFPGSNIWGDSHLSGDNSINFIAFDPTQQVFVSTDEPRQLPLSLQASVSPNPASENAVLSVHLESSGKVQVDMFDAYGRLALSQQFAGALGVQQFNLPLERLAAGVYTLRVIQGQEAGVARVVKY